MNVWGLVLERELTMAEIDILEYLKGRQNELERVNHPFSNRSLSFRYLYAYGVGVLALGNMKAITELKDRYDFFLECIALPKEQRDKIITDINNHFEFRLTECMKVLKTKEVQYCFLADLFQLHNLAVWSLDYCDKVIENYLQIFHMTEYEINFLKSIHKAAMKKDIMMARDCYHQFRNAGFDIAYTTLQYFYKGFTDQDEYRELIISAGKTLRLDKPTHIEGNIFVERGGSLLIDGADITIEGAIIVDGGRIQLCNSKLFAASCNNDFFLTVKDAAVVKIENSVVDCNNQCGFLRQKTGRLLIEESEFSHSKERRMIAFTGRYARIVRSSFLQGESGFVAISGASQMHISNCDFYQAQADYGSAFYSDSIDNVIIEECSFRNCKARYLGAAVYFKYQKLGQTVQKSMIYQCEPSEGVIFNAYDKEGENEKG